MKGALAPKRYELPSISFITLATGRSLLALRHRHEIAPLRSLEELPWAPDLLVGVADQLVPLRDPAHGAGEREDRREHRDRDAERLVDDARVEIDVGIELALDEVVVLQRYLLQRHCQLEQV